LNAVEVLALRALSAQKDLEVRRGRRWKDLFATYEIAISSISTPMIKLFLYNKPPLGPSPAWLLLQLGKHNSSYFYYTTVSDATS
jgi:hypothetical protein